MENVQNLTDFHSNSHSPQHLRRSARLANISKPFVASNTETGDICEESDENNDESDKEKDDYISSDGEIKKSRKRRGRRSKAISKEAGKGISKKGRKNSTKSANSDKKLSSPNQTIIFSSYPSTSAAISFGTKSFSFNEQTETNTLSSILPLKKTTTPPIYSFSASSEDEDEWEAVEHPKISDSSTAAIQIPIEGELAEHFIKNGSALQNPLVEQKMAEEKERLEWEHEIRLEIERRRRELQEDLHRIHFLCIIAHLRFFVHLLNSNRSTFEEKLRAALESGKDKEVFQHPSKLDLFRWKRRLENGNSKLLTVKKFQTFWCKNGSTAASHIFELIENQTFYTSLEAALLFFIYCAFVLGNPVRICFAFNPILRFTKLPKYMKAEKGRKGKRKVGKNDRNEERANEKCKSKMAKISSPHNKKKFKQNSKDESEESDFEEDDESLDSEEEEETFKKKRKITKFKRSLAAKPAPISKNGQKNSTAKMDDEKLEEDVDENLGEMRPYWNEYWDELEQRWICVDPFFGAVDRPAFIERKVGTKVLYVLAIDNDFGVRELGAKYASDFLALETRKLRTDKAWIDKTLNFRFLRAANSERVRLEDAAILDLLKSLPLPQKLVEFKNHPLYALEKDLLKFEAIYPRDTPPIGRVRNQDIYPRSAVHKLEGSLNWIKECRSIKEGEKAYKVVNARPKLNIPKEKREPLTLDLFGHWQTEPYKPPAVENGRIPRNEFGNIYMYKPEMIPRGCIHLRLPGIFQLARRFDLEAVPAVVGWEFSGGINHPILDGCVVLEKDTDTLRSAWREAASAKAAKEEKKNNERVWKNWKRLVKGKILLEQMRERFK